MEKIPFTFFLKELSITIKDGITPISHNVKVYTEGFRDGVRRKCQYYKMPLMAFSPIEDSTRHFLLDNIYRHFLL